jgi:hypothetical protein
MVASIIASPCGIARNRFEEVLKHTPLRPIVKTLQNRIPVAEVFGPPQSRPWVRALL